MSPLDRADALCAAGRPLRVVRSLAAAVMCVVAAATSHIWAGGAFSAEAAIAVFVGAVPVVWMLSARRITRGQLTGLLLLCQVGVHLAASSHEMGMGVGMVLGHAAATVVSAMVLAHGERFVWQLAERLGLRLAPLLRIGLLPAARRPAAPVASVRTLRDLCLTYSRSLRGPPVRTA